MQKISPPTQEWCSPDDIDVTVHGINTSGGSVALQIIGSGLGRTGTFSSKLALDKLGFGPCHHMFEVFQQPRVQMPLWIAAAQGRPDWDAIFAGFNSQIDHPGAQYYAQLAAYYPNAKVLHTVRDPDK